MGVVRRMMKQAKRVTGLVRDRRGQRLGPVHGPSLAIIDTGIGPGHHVECKHDVRLVVMKRTDRTNSRGILMEPVAVVATDSNSQRLAVVEGAVVIGADVDVE